MIVESLESLLDWISLRRLRSWGVCCATRYKADNKGQQRTTLKAACRLEIKQIMDKLNKIIVANV